MLDHRSVAAFLEAVLEDLDGGGLVVTDQDEVDAYVSDLDDAPSIANINQFKDTLYYTSEALADNGFEKRKIAEGVIIGVVGTIMAAGYRFEEAVKLVCEYLPHDASFHCMPVAWEPAFRPHFFPPGKYE